MEWNQIVEKVRLKREKFDRSHKCVNTDRPTKDETVQKHIEVLYESFEEIRVILHVNYSRLTQAQKVAADAFFNDVRDKLVHVLLRRGLDLTVPNTLQETVELPKFNWETSPGKSSENLESKATGIKPTPSPRKNLEASTGSEENRRAIEPSEKIGDNTVNTVNTVNMAQTVVQFLGTASKIIPEFDGKPENLQSFLDALTLLDALKETHEATAVIFIKTRLKGTARNLISTETTIQAIIARLRSTVKAEDVSVLTAKLMNIRQQGKTATSYVKEIEDLTKSLQGAYISDGLSLETAEKYATQAAVKAVTVNARDEKVRTIIQAGQFTNMDQLVTKFVSTCTDINGQSNSILHYGNKRGNRGNYRGRGNRNGRGNGQSRNSEYYNNGNNNRNYNRDNNRGRGRNGHWNSRNGRNIHHVAEDSENPTAPLNT